MGWQWELLRKFTISRFEQKVDNGWVDVPPPPLFSICFLTLLFQEYLRGKGGMPPKKLSAREIEEAATRVSEESASSEPSPPPKVARSEELEDTVLESSKVQNLSFTHLSH